MIIITSPAYVDDGAPFTALYSRAPIDVVIYFVDDGRPAFLRRRRSELLLFDIAFTGSSECAIHPAAHDASPHATRTSARQCPLPFSSSPPHTDVCHSCLPFSGAYRCETTRGEAARRLAPAHRLLLRSPPPVAQLSSAARRSGRVGRCGRRTRPCESRPGARSLAARSAVQLLPLPPPPRPRLPWPQARPPSPSPDPLALRSARPCDRARPARRPGYGSR